MVGHVHERHESELDPDAQVDSNLKMVAGKIRSRRTAIAAISGDPDPEIELTSP